MRFRVVHTFLLLFAACDPILPGASGTIILDGTQPSGTESWRTIALRACPLTAGDATHCADVGNTANMADLVRGKLDARELSFPVSYTVGGDGIGCSSSLEWRILVWASAGDVPDSALGPASGESFGTAAFTLMDAGFGRNSCGAGVTQDVDVHINALAP